MAEPVPLHAGEEDVEALRQIEALIFAAARPLSEKDLRARLSGEPDVARCLATLKAAFRNRGINLVEVAEGWTFRTAPDLAPLMSEERAATKKLSAAALETLSIIAYHQPVTRAEIEEVRGVAVAKGTLDILLDTGWVRLRGRRRAPGRPVTFGTTPEFLSHFGLATVADLPGLDDLKGAGLLEGTPPDGFSVPSPNMPDSLTEDEDPLDDDDSDTDDAR
ncbi:MAG: SMC-Scp complex subunit ScpB [Pseudomonadota bacterium]